MQEKIEQKDDFLLKISKIFGHVEKKHYLCSRFENFGTLPERLGIGLQNRGRRFESARYLQKPLTERLFFI